MKCDTQFFQLLGVPLRHGLHAKNDTEVYEKKGMWCSWSRFLALAMEAAYDGLETFEARTFCSFATARLHHDGSRDR